MMISLVTTRAVRATRPTSQLAAIFSGLKPPAKNLTCFLTTSTFSDDRASIQLHHQPLLLQSTGIVSVMDNNGLNACAHQLRAFSTSSKPKKSTKTTITKSAATTTTTSVNGSYLEEKRAAKDRRRALYEARQARTERLKTRRSSEQPRDELRRAFRSFFIKKKVDEEYMNRKARQAGLEWKINVSVILERLNIVQADKEPWEIEYENLRAHLDRFGKMYPKELYNVDYDADDVALTDEELLAMLPKEFTPAPRETEADKTGNVRTVQRKLKTKLFLAVYDRNKTNNNGEKNYWHLPTVELLGPDETLLEAAKRALATKVGSQVEYWCPSNCPCSVDLMAFPSVEERQERGYYGTKTFFMRLQHDEGDVSDSTMNVKDFAWLDSAEMVERVQNEQGDYMAKFYHYML